MKIDTKEATKVSYDSQPQSKRGVLSRLRNFRRNNDRNKSDGTNVKAKNSQYVEGYINPTKRSRSRASLDDTTRPSAMSELPSRRSLHIPSNSWNFDGGDAETLRPSIPVIPPNASNLSKINSAKSSTSSYISPPKPKESALLTPTSNYGGESKLTKQPSSGEKFCCFVLDMTFTSLKI